MRHLGGVGVRSGVDDADLDQRVEESTELEDIQVQKAVYVIKIEEAHVL